MSDRPVIPAEDVKHRPHTSTGPGLGADAGGWAAGGWATGGRRDTRPAGRLPLGSPHTSQEPTNEHPR